MLRVWWTVPGSAVAWEWRPAVPRLFAAKRVVAADGIEYLEYGEEIPGPPRPYMGLPAGQGLADFTALFAQEANVTPANLVVTWLEGRTAVRWDRTAGRWTRHTVELRGGRPAVGPPDRVPEIPERIVLDAETYDWGPVRAAGRIAVGLLGLTPIPTGRDVLARQVEENQDATCLGAKAPVVHDDL